MHHSSEKNNLFFARPLGISSDSNESYRRYNFQAVVIFPEISGNIKFPENLQPSSIPLPPWLLLIFQQCAQKRLIPRQNNKSAARLKIPRATENCAPCFLHMTRGRHNVFVVADCVFWWYSENITCQELGHLKGERSRPRGQRHVLHPANISQQIPGSHTTWDVASLLM